MDNKTPEERRAAAAKGRATRRRREEEAAAFELERRKYAGRLGDEIRELESRLEALKRADILCEVAGSLTGRRLLTQAEIVAEARPQSSASGVYFLVTGDQVAYVGQSVNVHARAGQHHDKQADRWAYVPCPVEQLDVLESLYIHLLRPRLNGRWPGGSEGEKHAPLSLEALLARATAPPRRPVR